MRKSVVCLDIMLLCRLSFCCLSSDRFETLKKTLEFKPFLNVISDKEQPSIQLIQQIKSLSHFNNFIKVIDLDDATICHDQVSDLFCPGSNLDLERYLNVTAACNLATKHPTLIVLSNGVLINSALPSVRIDQQVYQFNSSNGQLIEEYTINKQVTRNILGHMKGNQFQPTKLGMESFHQRRRNFHGLEISAMTGNNIRSSYLKKGYKERATFHENNNTYDVTKELYGPYKHYFDQLALEFNFTYKLYSLTTGGWFVLNKNGSISGILANLVDGSAEMVASAIVLNPTRINYVDYLPVIDREKYSISISHFRNKASGDGHYNWSTFVKPFSLDLWLVLIIIAIVLAMWLHFTSLTLDQDQRSSLLDWLWIAITANFGKKPMYLPKNHSRTAVFTCLIVGNVIWIGYRAYLISALSVQQPRAFPFTSLEELSNSNYRSVLSVVKLNKAQCNNIS